MESTTPEKPASGGPHRTLSFKLPSLSQSARTTAVEELSNSGKHVSTTLNTTFNTTRSKARDGYQQAKVGMGEVKTAIVSDTWKGNEETNKLRQKMKQYVGLSVLLVLILAFVLHFWGERLAVTNSRRYVVSVALGIFFLGLFADTTYQWAKWQYQSTALEGTRIKRALLFKQLHFRKSHDPEPNCFWKMVEIGMNSNTLAAVCTVTLWLNLTAISFQPESLPWGKQPSSAPVKRFGDVAKITLIDVDFLNDKSITAVVFHTSFWISVPLVLLAYILLQRPLKARSDLVEVSLERQKKIDAVASLSKVRHMLRMVDKTGSLHLKPVRSRSFRLQRSVSSRRMDGFTDDHTPWYGACCCRKSNGVAPMPQGVISTRQPEHHLRAVARLPASFRNQNEEHVDEEDGTHTGTSAAAAAVAAIHAAEESNLRVLLCALLLAKHRQFLECEEAVKAAEEKISKLRDAAGTFTSVLCSVLYMIIVRAMLSALSCSFQGNQNCVDGISCSHGHSNVTDPNGVPGSVAGHARPFLMYMTKDPGMRCFHGFHWVYVIVSVTALSMYYPITVMCRPFFQLLEVDLELLQQQEFVFLVVNAQTALSVVDVFFQHQAELVLISAMVVHLLIAATIKRFQVFNVLELNDFLFPSFIFAAWIAACSLAAQVSQDDHIPAVVMYCGAFAFAVELCRVYRGHKNGNDLEDRQHHANIVIAQQEAARLARKTGREAQTVSKIAAEEMHEILKEGRHYKSLLQAATKWKKKTDDSKARKMEMARWAAPLDLPQEGPVVIPYFGYALSFREL